MKNGLKVLGELTMLRTYSKDNENWDGIVTRYLKFIKETQPKLEKEINKYGEAIRNKLCVPSMRALQFAGDALKQENARAYNCSFIGISNMKDFADTCYLLSCGCGVGFSVERKFINSLPEIQTGYDEDFVIQDTRESWADSILKILQNHQVRFDYSLIRPAGSSLSSGGTASGPKPLQVAHESIRKLLKKNTKFTSVMVADIVCFIAQAIVAGGVRRSATICLYDHDDVLMKDFKGNAKFSDEDLQEMITMINQQTDDNHIHSVRLLNTKQEEVKGFKNTNSNNRDDVINYILKQYEKNDLSSVIIQKHKNDEPKVFKTTSWFQDNIQRSQANISAVVTKNNQAVRNVVSAMINSQWGEPGIVLKSKDDSKNSGVNPCCELSLLSHQFCNLTEIIASNCSNTEDFLYACKAASFFGTLQASLTNFKYIQPKWKKNTEDDALIGVSITGQAMSQEILTAENLCKGAQIVKQTNKQIAKLINIKPAKRTTTTKPSGTTSCVMECTSGVHAAHARYTIRRVTVSKKTSLGKRIVELYGNQSDSKYSFIQQDIYSKDRLVLQFPCEYKNAIYRDEESAIQLLERMKKIYQNWIIPGHTSGDETNNVSLTVSVRQEEKQDLTEWLVNNQDCYRGISIAPFDFNFPLAPFEAVSETEYQKYFEKFPDIDTSLLGIKSNIKNTVACSGGQCEINSL